MPKAKTDAKAPAKGKAGKPQGHWITIHTPSGFHHVYIGGPRPTAGKGSRGPRKPTGKGPAPGPHPMGSAAAGFHAKQAAPKAPPPHPHGPGAHRFPKAPPPKAPPRPRPHRATKAETTAAKQAAAAAVHGRQPGFRAALSKAKARASPPKPTAAPAPASPPPTPPKPAMPPVASAPPKPAPPPRAPRPPKAAPAPKPARAPQATLATKGLPQPTSPLHHETVIAHGMLAQDPRGGIASIQELRQHTAAHFPTKESFDQAVLKLSDEGKVVLHAHDYVTTDEQRAAYVHHPTALQRGQPTYYNAISFREGYTPPAPPLSRPEDATAHVPRPAKFEPKKGGKS